MSLLSFPITLFLAIATIIDNIYFSFFLKVWKKKQVLLGFFFYNDDVVIFLFEIKIRHLSIIGLRIVPLLREQSDKR